MATCFHTEVGDYAHPTARGNAIAPITLIPVSAATAMTLGRAM
jgi:hypothetical protein